MSTATLTTPLTSPDSQIALPLPKREYTRVDGSNSRIPKELSRHVQIANDEDGHVVILVAREQAKAPNVRNLVKALNDLHPTAKVIQEPLELVAKVADQAVSHVDLQARQKKVIDIARSALMKGASDIIWKPMPGGTVRVEVKIADHYVPTDEAFVAEDMESICRAAWTSTDESSRRGNYDKTKPATAVVKLRLAEYQLQRLSTGLRFVFSPTDKGPILQIRLQDRTQDDKTLDDVRLMPTQRDALARLSARPSGLVPITGPVNSGKNGFANKIAQARICRHPTKLFIALGTPVETDLPGSLSLSVHPGEGEDDLGAFLRYLSHVLRMDYHALYVTETREASAGRMLVEAAAKGRYVMTSLHTETPTMAIEVFRDWGIERYQLINPKRMIGFIGVRLLGRLCERCALASRDYPGRPRHRAPHPRPRSS